MFIKENQNDFIFSKTNENNSFYFKMTTNAEADLTQKLETSSLEAAQNEIPIGKDTADIIKAQANEAFRSKISLFFVWN